MSSNNVLISRQKLYDMMKNSGCETFDEQLNFIKKKIEKRVKNYEQNDLNKKFSYFKSEYKSRWEKAHRMQHRFIKENKNWLNASIVFLSLPAQNNRGRPEVAFKLSSERNKRKKTQELRNNTHVGVLSHATQMSLWASGQIEAVKLLQEITTTTPKRASKYRKVYKELQTPKKLSSEDELAVLVDAKLSRHQYNVIRMSAPDKFPSYKVIQESKKNCYPKPENIKVTSTYAEVPLQALLDHTVEKLILVQKPVINSIQENELDKFLLYSKWGFDGRSLIKVIVIYD